MASLKIENHKIVLASLKIEKRDKKQRKRERARVFKNRAKRDINIQIFTSYKFLSKLSNEFIRYLLNIRYREKMLHVYI